MPGYRRHVAQGLAALVGALAIAGAVQASTTVTYSYDTLGRIATAVYVDGTTGQTITYTYSYDAAGNRTLVNTTVG